MVKTGLHYLFADKLNLIKNKNIGILSNPSSVDENYKHILSLVKEHKQLKLKAIFSPQHGYKADKQANMIVSHNMIDPVTKVAVFSLYNKTRAPTKEMLSELDTIVIDLQDVGTRVYTFIYTMYNMMEAAKAFNKEIIVLDRPNPIGCLSVEGNILEEEFESFVGLHPLPMRHGMTIGELALLFNSIIGCNLVVIEMKNYKRDMFFEDTLLPWIMPSPNMPTVLTALLYPAGVLFEGTNVSEGRGTTLPFELIGAPYIDAPKLKKEMDSYGFSFAYLREVYFEPTFDKFAGKACQGLQIHVIDKKRFKPYLIGLALLRTISKMYYKDFIWLEPPYEYEYNKMPIDIIIGSKRLRKSLAKAENIYYIEQRWEQELDAFVEKRSNYMLY